MEILWLGESDEQVLDVMQQEAPAGARLVTPEGGTPTASQLSSAQYIVNGSMDIGADVIGRAPALRMIQRLGAGLDGIDLIAAERAGVEVCNLPARNAAAVAELTIALGMACARDLVRLNSSMKNASWSPNVRLGSTFELQGSSWGVIGFGNIGQAVARRTSALGMKTLFYDVASPDSTKECPAEFAPLDELLRASRIVSVHLPLTEQTAGLIGADRISAMPEKSVLISISRAGIVDEDALCNALESQHLAGAAVDVWDHEPVPADNRLLRAPNLIATPHAGAQTHDTVQRVFRDAFAAITTHATTHQSAS